MVERDTPSKQIHDAHLPGLVQDTPIKSGGVNLLLWAHPPLFLSHIMRSW